MDKKRNFKKKVTKEELAKSPIFAKNINNAIRPILADKGFKISSRYVTVEIGYKPEEEATAYTNGSFIYVNAGNPFFYIDKDGKEIDTDEFYLRILGVVLHEVGHILYTPFNTFRNKCRELESGKFAKPLYSELSEEEEEYFEELKELIEKNKFYGFTDESVKKLCLKEAVINIYSSLNNIVEDGRIEILLLNEAKRYFGFYSGLKSLRKYQLESFPDFEEYNKDINNFCNLCLLYSKYEDLKKYDNGFEAFENAQLIIDDMMQSPNASAFMEHNIKLLIIAWNEIKAMLEKYMDNKCSSESSEAEESSEAGEGSETSEGSSGEGRSGKSKASSSKPKDLSEKEVDEINEKLKEITKAAKEAEEKTSKKQNRSEDGISSENSFKKNEGEKEKPSGSTPKEKKGEEKEEKIEVGIAKFGEYDDDTSYSDMRAREELGRIMMEVSEEAYYDKLRHINSRKNEEILRQVVSKNGWSSSIIEPTLEPNAKEIIENVNKKVGRLLKKTSREIVRHYETDKRTAINKRKYYGTKFNATTVANNDYKNFERKKKPQKVMPKLAVGLCIDESGSMGGNGRYLAARDSAICLYQLFQSIPRLDIGVFGFTADYRTQTDIIQYVDFGEKEPKALERLAGITARYNNRDVAALEFVCEKLLKEDAEKRILIMISDGQPAASGYGGPRSCGELGKAADHYKSKDIEIYVAAIGSDKEQLQSIYKNQKFLDISDLSVLPKTLVDIIKRKL